jgi:predicted RNA binding protein YcfA (HicA-like mRNA interferase family)/predicted RNase H-like HicB family nuclease
MASEKRFADVRRMLEKAGYQLERVRGSHHTFTKSGVPPVIVPVHRARSNPIMSAKSKNSSTAIDRPFAPDVLAKAEKVAQQYQVILAFEDGEWYGRGLEMPYVFGDGKTPAQCVAETREALTTAVATLLELGERPPTPARAGRRTTQINVRLTAEEKALLEVTAQRKGFNGLSEFIRAAALESTR